MNNHPGLAHPHRGNGWGPVAEQQQDASQVLTFVVVISYRFYVIWFFIILFWNLLILHQEHFLRRCGLLRVDGKSRNDGELARLAIVLLGR